MLSEKNVNFNFLRLNCPQKNKISTSWAQIHNSLAQVTLSLYFFNQSTAVSGGLLQPGSVSLTCRQCFASLSVPVGSEVVKPQRTSAQWTLIIKAPCWLPDVPLGVRRSQYHRSTCSFDTLFQNAASGTGTSSEPYLLTTCELKSSHGKIVFKIVFSIVVIVTTDRLFLMLWKKHLPTTCFLFKCCSLISGRVFWTASVSVLFLTFGPSEANRLLHIHRTNMRGFVVTHLKTHFNVPGALEPSHQRVCVFLLWWWAELKPAHLWDFPVTCVMITRWSV